MTFDPRRLIDVYERAAPEPLPPDEHRWLSGALALIPVHGAATAGLVGGTIGRAEVAVTIAESWRSRHTKLTQ